MKRMQVYAVGYAVFLGGLIAALWKLGVIARVGAGWTLIGVVIAIGLGIMFAVARTGGESTIEIDRKS